MRRGKDRRYARSSLALAETLTSVADWYREICGWTVPTNLSDEGPDCCEGYDETEDVFLGTIANSTTRANSVAGTTKWERQFARSAKSQTSIKRFWKLPLPRFGPLRRGPVAFQWSDHEGDFEADSIRAECSSQESSAVALTRTSIPRSCR